jgi:hypothetical protein
LFIARVAGQAAVAFLGVSWLPAMERWYSGVIAYPWLLLAQALIITLMVKISVDFTRRGGFFYEAKRALASPVLIFGYVYLLAMVARFLFIMDRPIPIFFHWVLAAFVIALGHSHRRRLVS